MPITPEAFNRVRESNLHYGAARERLGMVRSVYEANPSDAHLQLVHEAEMAAAKALENFNRTLGAAGIRPGVVGG